jgi:hypothetical protein
MTSVSGFNLIATKCCGAVYSTPKYASINTSAYEYWTDGARLHSLMPTDGGLRRCGCGTYFLLSNTFTVGFESERVTQGAEFVKDADLEFLLSMELPSAVEITVRRRYWRFLNEPYRDLYRDHRQKEEAKKVNRDSFISHFFLRIGLLKHKKEEPLEFTVPSFTITNQLTQNLERLLVLLENEVNKDYLEITEILRELSRFDEASKTLAKFSEEKNKIADLLKQLLVQQDNAPYRFRL